MCGDGSGQIAGRDTRFLGDLHGDVGRVVTVLGVSGTLHAQRHRQNSRVEVTFSERRPGGVQHCYSEFSGSHFAMLSRVDSDTRWRPGVLVTSRDSHGGPSPLPRLPGVHPSLDPDEAR
jgi:hypothetical protein